MYSILVGSNYSIQMKEKSKVQTSTITKNQIQRQVRELVATYFNYKRQPPLNSNIFDRMVSKVMKVLTQDRCEPNSLESEVVSVEKEFDICSDGVKEEWNNDMKKIGIQEHEPIQMVLLSKLAQRSFELGSIEESEQKDDSSVYLHPIKVQVYSNQQRPQNTNGQMTNLRYYYMGYKKNESSHENKPLKKIDTKSVSMDIYQQSDPFISQSQESKEQESEYQQQPNLIRKTRQKQPNPTSKGLKIHNKNKNLQKILQKREHSQFYNKKSKKVLKKTKKIKRKGKARIDENDIINQSKGRRPQNPQMEQLLVPWIHQQISQGIILTQKDIRQKARNLAEQLQSNRLRKFSASKGWIQKFFRRYPHISTLVSRKNKEITQQKILSRQNGSHLAQNNTAFFSPTAFKKDIRNLQGHHQFLSQ